jgi:hypothetical protein
MNFAELIGCLKKLFNEVGNKFQYYVDTEKLYICSANTAKKRWIDWWANEATR